MTGLYNAAMSPDVGPHGQLALLPRIYNRSNTLARRRSTFETCRLGRRQEMP